MTQPTEEQIRTRAYYLWEADGRPHGRDWEYWIKAKNEISTPAQKPVIAAAGSAKKSEVAKTEAPRKRSNSRQPAYA